MSKRDLNAIKCTISAIDSANSNIKRYDQFGEFKELLIVPNGDKIQALIKQMGYSDKDNPNPIYVTGKSKEAVLDALRNEQNAFKEKMEAKLEQELTTII